jgi:hypothetical protein
MNYFLPVHCGAPDMANKYIKKINLNAKSIFFDNNNNYSIIKFKHPNEKIDKSFKSGIDNHDLGLFNAEYEYFNKIIGSYLAGLIEGDGYISITNKNTIILGITFNIKDKPLAEKLLNYIGTGFIVKRKTNSIELRFSSKKSLYKIIKLVNGKFRTPKVDQLYKLIDWMNKNHISSNELKIIKLPIDNSNLISNNWLAGFIDADGHFYIRLSLKQIICKFSLEQRMIYPKTKESYNNILEKISLFFNVQLHTRIRKNYKNSYYIIRVENQNSIKLLIDYLDQHTLLSSKHLDYLNWKETFLIILSKNHFSEEGRKSISTYKNTMNDKRDYFDWKHLNFFFK